MVTDLTFMDTSAERAMSIVDRQVIEIIRAKERFPDTQTAELARRNLEEELARDHKMVRFVGAGSQFPLDILDIRSGSQLKFVDAYLLKPTFIPSEAYFVYQRNTSDIKRDDIQNNTQVN